MSETEGAAFVWREHDWQLIVQPGQSPREICRTCGASRLVRCIPEPSGWEPKVREARPLDFWAELLSAARDGDAAAVAELRRLGWGDPQVSPVSGVHVIGDPED